MMRDTMTLAFLPALHTSCFTTSSTSSSSPFPLAQKNTPVAARVTSSLAGPGRPPRKRRARRTSLAKRGPRAKNARARTKTSAPKGDAQDIKSRTDAAGAAGDSGLPTTPGVWSSDFLQLCNEQVNLLMQTIPNVDMVALFFRRENEQEGTLEFTPLIVHTSGEDDKPARVWISSGTGGETELENSVPSRVLPGSVPANWLLPDYPFTSVAHHGGIYMSDGGLCVPVTYNDVVAGTIIMRPKLVAEHQHQQWKRKDIERADMVAKSIALAAALEGKWHAYKGLLGTSRTLLESARSLIGTTLHQIRSPLQALVTFGHLMMRKLPVNDSNRDLAKHVIVEALRLDDLLKPLDDARDTFVLPEAVTENLGPKKRTRRRLTKKNPNIITNDSGPSDTPPVQPNPFQSLSDGPQLIWLSDLLQPQADRARLLAARHHITFISDIDEDSAPALTVEKFVVEAVTNLIDNALKYTPEGSHMGISTNIPPPEGTASLQRVTGFVVWDTGYGITAEEIDKVCEYGFRGSAASTSGAEGSGLGLGITQQLLRSCNGRLDIHSPLSSRWDPRDSGADKTGLPGSAFVVSLKRPSDGDDSPDE